ncbi:MAG: PAS domain S-box protein [Gallionellaceae bacterium]|nr:PAS domain S-box protein [Gallionellaceae bacterium]
MHSTSPSLPVSRSRPQRLPRTGSVLPFLVLAVSLAIAHQLWRNAQQNAVHALQTQFDFRVRDAVDDVVKRMLVYQQGLRGAQGLFAASRSVARGEFHEFVATQGLAKNFPGIQGVGFALIVPQAAKVRHIAAMRAEGFPGYTIKPEGGRDTYTAIIYLEPFNERNQRALGYDMYAEPARRAAMELARDSGQAAISGRVTLVQETGTQAQAGFLMYQPVYKNGTPHGTLAERRANIVGWVYVPFRSNDLMDGVLGLYADKIDIEIFDGEKTLDEALLYDSSRHRADMATLFRATRNVEIAGRTWTVALHTLPAFEAMLDKEKPQIVANTGIGASLLLVLLTWLLVYGRQRALQMAAAMERESIKNETLLRTASDGIYIFDIAGKVLQVNDAFCRMLGYTQEELLTMNVTQWNAQWPAEELLARIAALGSGNRVFETRHCRRDGSIIDVEISASRVEIDGRQLVYNSVRDITERKKTEHALRDSEERWKFALEGAGDGVWDWNLQTGKIVYSKRYKEILGFPEDESWDSLDDWKNHVNPEDMQQAMVSLEAYLDGMAATYNVEYRMLCRGGGWKWILSRGKVVSRDAGGRPLRMIGTHTDITGQKQASEALHTSEGQFRSVFDYARVGMHLAGPDYKYLKINKAFCEMTGYSEEELLAHDFKTITHPEDMEQNLTLSKKLLAGEINSFQLEKRYIRKDGGILWGDVAVSAVRDENGKLLYVIAIIQDITEHKRSQEKLLTLSRAVESSPASVVITGRNGAIEYVNKRFIAATGYTAQEAIGQNPRILNAGIQPKGFYKKLWETILAGKDWSGEIYNKKKNGEIYLEQAFISPIRDDKGNITHFVAVKEDITERKRLAEELQKADRNQTLLEAHQESETRLRAIIDTALNAVVQMNAEGIITGWNSQAEKIFGWTREEALGRVLHETIIPPQYREAHVHGLKRFLACGEGSLLNSQTEMAALHRDGHEFPVELSITSINTADGCEFNAFIQDITQRKESENLIWKQANYDTLTGLPNRRMLHDRLTQEIKKAHRADLKMALLFIDLDRFKEVNDTLGHNMGDLLLVEAARRIGDCVREADTVARLGGDEFIIILSELEDASSIERVAESILQKMAEPFQLGNEVAYVSASMGITLYPDDATEVEDLLKDADQAMYVAKNAGRNRLSYFTPALEQAAQTRLHLLNDLRGALAGNQFRVYYQPIVELATGRIHKAEALIRWQHPVRGMVSPAQFIPLAEETGLIVKIGDWVFREAARQARHWRARHDPMFQISVNKSPTQFRQSGKAHEVWLDYLRELGLPGQSITIEITEGLLLDAESNVTDRLFEFRDAGMQVSIDDFGTGYSSLSYLKKFDIDYLKIDQSFVRDLATDPNDMALAEAIIVMAHKLGLKVIAEGVETEQQRGLLAAAGCDYAQGYLYSRPVPAEEFEVLLVQGDK